MGLFLVYFGMEEEKGNFVQFNVVCSLVHGDLKNGVKNIFYLKGKNKGGAP